MACCETQTRMGVIAMVLVMSMFGGSSSQGPEEGRWLQLPEPRRQGLVSVEEALQKRRSNRRFQDRALTLMEVSQLVWSAQGVTDAEGFRTAPSAGALYPLEIDVSVGNVEGLASGVYRYRPDKHALQLRREQDIRKRLARAALQQSWIGDGAVILVLSAQYSRTTGKYGERGRRYVHMEVGHSAQNICLQAISLGLVTTVVGAFDDEEVRHLVNLASNERPLCIMPVGHPD